MLAIIFNEGTLWRSWLRHRATSRNVVVTPWHNPSGRTRVPGSTQPLREMDTVNISGVITADA